MSCRSFVPILVSQKPSAGTLHAWPAVPLSSPVSLHSEGLRGFRQRLIRSTALVSRFRPPALGRPFALPSHPG